MSRRRRKKTLRDEFDFMIDDSFSQLMIGILSKRKILDMANLPLSDQYREEIEDIVANALAKNGLSPAQKWETGLILAAMLAGSLTIFGAAGYFLILTGTRQMNDRPGCRVSGGLFYSSGLEMTRRRTKPPPFRQGHP